MLSVCSQVDIDDGPFPPSVAAILTEQFNLQSQHVAYTDYGSEYITGIGDTAIASQISPYIEKFASAQQIFTIPVGSLEVWTGIHPGIVLRLIRTDRLITFENGLRSFLNDLAIKPYAGRRAGTPILGLHLATRDLEPLDVPILDKLFGGIVLSSDVPITNICAVSNSIDLGLPGRFMTTLLLRYDFGPEQT